MAAQHPGDTEVEALRGPLPPATNGLSFSCTSDASKVNEFQLQVEVWLRVGFGKVKARSPAHDQDTLH